MKRMRVGWQINCYTIRNISLMQNSDTQRVIAITDFCPKGIYQQVLCIPVLETFKKLRRYAIFQAVNRESIKNTEIND